MSNTTINTITVTMLFIIVVGCILGLSFQQHLLCEAKIALVQEQLLDAKTKRRSSEPSRALDKGY
jgi:hypothetical protein